MRIVIAGSSGYLGGALVSRLHEHGHDVVRLVRREALTDDQVEWDPYRKPFDPAVLDGADAVVNLCGAGVGDKRWTPAYKGLIQASRLEPTRILAEAVAAAKVPVLLNGSAVGYYGDGGALSEVDESAPAADDYLGRLARSWEAAASPAVEAGARVVFLRTTHVFGPGALMLKKLVPLFKLGLGGRFGSGEQYLPWISLLDWTRAVEFLLTHDVSGPVNLAGPTPITNRDFATALAAALGRKAPFAVPGFALRAGAGEAAVELLRGVKVRPRALEDAGFVWEHASLTDTLGWALEKR
ncbi:TIGR01777 family oxidoreductase [Phytomonospora sp. NPDC050363]|uniref:TIGR01777 family oxidoreductase n=1 Tax=Phytomonospora sp. NPDC050363 TaxID=3155642 RepID=UPI0033EBA57C